MGASEKTPAGVLTLPLLLLLPQDILVEILSKLPAKLLVRLRCVSKFFCPLIADHGFGVLHRSLSFTLPSRAGILIAIIPQTPGESPPAYYTINFSQENPQPGMLQANRLGFLDAEPFLKGYLRSSTDSLICLSKPNGDVVVCNVSTGQRISLPTTQSHSSISSTRALLGFDSQSKRYKVFMSTRMIDWKRSSKRICLEYKHWVLTIGVDKSWREINYCSYNPFYHFDNAYGCPSYSDTSVYIDGIIYSYNWLSKDDPPSFDIVAFEVGSESYSLIPLPAEVPSSSQYYYTDIFGEKYHYWRNFGLLQVDGGRLAIVLVRKISWPCYMDCWTWEKSKECWEKITMVIPLEESRPIYRSFRSLRYTTNHAGEIVVLCVDSKQFFILVCNLKSEVWRKFDVGGVEEFPIIFKSNVRMYRTMENVFSLM